MPPVRPFDVLKGAYCEPPNSPARTRLGLAGASLWWGHTAEPKYILLSDFEDVLPGHGLRHGLEGLAEALLRSGFADYGPRERVVVFVDHLGVARLQDGNHRILVAKDLMGTGRLPSNLPVPTIISYRGNSDLRAGAWLPRSMLAWVQTEGCP